jgi:hypothetical protein
MHLSDVEVRKWFWNMDIQSVSSPFPRDIGKWRYPKAYTWQDYYSYILKCNTLHEDAFVSFYSDSEQDTQAGRIFLDVDGEDVPSLWNNIRPFLSIFWNHLLVFFSGKKGFHVIVCIEPVQMDELYENRKRLYEVLSTWCQTPIDKQTFLDRKRIFRISFTYNTKGERWKIPVHVSWEFDRILSLSKEATGDFTPCVRKISPVNYNVFLREPYEVIEETIFQMQKVKYIPH